ncbi:MAG: DUF305 domain-containing protein [Candidatus Peribacteraceae bacterium]|nr:DUF305 domain-containing protein [Candidatus Peribacteraceae bacterium]
MMDTMYTTGFGFSALWALHILSVIAFFTGLLFIIVLAIRTFSAAQLKKWAVSLMVIGAVACLFTIAVRGTPWMHAGSGMGGNMRMMKMDNMGGMMEHDDDDMMDMSMDDMSGMLEGLSGDEFDAAFIQGMIPHHQGAIDMANAALTSSKHAEIQKMAKDIMSAQQQEIDQMRQWQKSWGYQE